MPILVSCPCGKQMRAKDELAGKRVKCPGCGNPVLVAEAAEAAETAPLPRKSSPTPRSATARPERREEDAPEPRKGPRPASREAERGDRGEAPFYWIDTNALGGKVFALSDEAVYMADVGEEELDKARKALDKGTPVEDALAGAKTIIYFDQIDKVESNIYHAFIDVHWQPDKGEKQETNLLCPDKQSRDEMMEGLEERLGWKGELIEMGRLRASLAPLAVIGLFGFMTFCFVMAMISPDQGDGGGKVVRTNLLGAVFVWAYNLVGPIGIIVLSAPFILGGVVWLVMRMHRPPVLLTLAPRKRSKKPRD
jgi:hypothetical protein